MQFFFNNMASLHQFTLDLDTHVGTLSCHQCAQNNQFTSHGFVYKKQHNGDKIAVGKRILCSARYGKTGCGATRRLYLAEVIPSLAYTSMHISCFLIALIQGESIQAAYQSATKTIDPRNAYRWLRKLQDKLTDFRILLKARIDTQIDQLTFRTRQLQLLLPTLQRLFLDLQTTVCSSFQMRYQTSFI